MFCQIGVPLYSESPGFLPQKSSLHTINYKVQAAFETSVGLCAETGDGHRCFECRFVKVVAVRYHHIAAFHVCIHKFHAGNAVGCRHQFVGIIF